MITCHVPVPLQLGTHLRNLKMSGLGWDVEALQTDERLDEPIKSNSADGLESVPARLVHVAETLKALGNVNRQTVDKLSELSLAEVTAKIREIEQRTQQLAREEGRDEIRVGELVRNLSQKGIYAPILH